MNSAYWNNEVMRRIYTDNADITFYIGLSSTIPAEDGSNVSEPSGGNYARVAIDGFETPRDGVVSNTNALQFPTSTEVWFATSQKAAYYVIFDGATNGANVLGAGALAVPMAIDENVTLVIPPKLLSISLYGDTIKNNGALHLTIDGLEVTSVAIPAGYTTGGEVTLTDDIENRLSAI